MSGRICFVVTDAISLNVLYRDQLEYLVERGFKLTMICGGSTRELEILRGRDVGKVINIGFVRTPDIWRDSVSLVRLLLHFCFHRYDLVLITTPKTLLIGSIAAFVTFQRRRCAFFQGRIYENFHGFRRWIYRFFDRITVACAHEVLFVSPSLMLEFVAEIPVAQGKGRVLGDGSGNGICHRTFSQDAVSKARIEEIKRDLSLSASDFIILVVGRICNDKGLQEITQVAEHLADLPVKLIFVGSPENEAASAQLDKLVASQTVRYVPFTSDVVSYFALADVHLFLSHREGFGNVAIEAAAMNVPTIAFDVVGVRDSVENGVSGVRVPFGDVEAVVAAIRELYAQPEWMRKEFSSARQWAIDHFARERVWENFANFYAGKHIAGRG